MLNFYQNRWFIIIFLIAFLPISCKKKEVNYADKTPPYVVATYPENGATGVTVNLEKIVVTFSEDINPESANFSAIQIKPVIYGEIRVVENKLNLLLHTPLEYDTRYTVTLTKKITDLFGNHMRSDYTFSFSTEHDTIPPPPPLFFSTFFITNQNPIVVGGTKQANSGIKVNGEVYVPVDYSTSFSLQLPLVEGKNIFNVVAFDRAGNESDPVTLTVILDTQPPPPPTLFYPVKTRDFSVTVTGVREEGSEVFLYDRDTNYLLCDDKEEREEWKCVLNLNEEGKRCFFLYAVDSAGNRSDTENFCITRDITPPSFFSLSNTDSAGNVTIFSGEKESNSYLFLNGVWDREDFSSSSWSTNFAVKDGLNILNFSITDDLFNSIQRIYNFYHFSKPPVLYLSYPMRGTEFSSPVTRITLFFTQPVTLAPDCGKDDLLYQYDGTPYNVDRIEWKGREVTLIPLQPVEGSVTGLYVNSDCFVRDLNSMNNPPWWVEYPERATTSDGKAWFIPLKDVGSEYGSSPPSPLYPYAITTGECDYYSCEVTISPFYSDGETGSEEVLVETTLYNSQKFVTTTTADQGSLNLRFTNLIPFTCPKVELKVKNNSGNTFYTDKKLTPHVSKEYVRTVTGINSWEYYAKVVSGDWNGDGIPDIAMAIVKNPEEYPFSNVEVLLFTLDQDEKWDGDYRVINLGSTGYGLAVSEGASEDKLLLLDPVQKKLGIFQWSMSVTEYVNRDEIAWVDLNTKLHLNDGNPFEMMNISSITGRENNFALLVKRNNGDNFFILDDKMEILDSLYISGIFPKYPAFRKGNFATRGWGAETLCVSNFSYDDGKGRVLCYYGGDDFPQHYPFFSVTDPTAKMYSNFGYLFTLVDMNGDGFEDLISFEHGNPGRFFIYYGGDYPDKIPDEIIDYPGGYFAGKIKFKKREYLTGSNFSTGKMEIILRSDRGYNFYPICLNGRELNIFSRVYQVGENLYLLLECNRNSDSVTISFLYLE